MTSSAALRLATVCVLLAGAVQAQVPAGISADRVTFFTEPNFRGESLIVEAGASVEDLARLARPGNQPWIYAISSVRIEGAARATVFSAPRYTGERLELTRSISDLYGERRGREAGATWDRAIASVVVAGPPQVVAPRPDQPPPPVVVVRPPPPPPTTVIVQDARPRIDRRTAEMFVQRAFREVLDRPADPEGLRTYTDRLIREGWSEQQMIQQLQRSAEARAINADQAIAKIYRDVLGRDPDARGLAHYRGKWKDGWTQGQIREDLRRSPEGRDTYVRNVITRAYKELLGRDPDPSGYATYEKAMRERGYTEQQVRAAIMSGDEYRQRRGKR